jgi:hypothetical protein
VTCEPRSTRQNGCAPCQLTFHPCRIRPPPPWPGVSNGGHGQVQHLLPLGQRRCRGELDVHRVRGPIRARDACGRRVGVRSIPTLYDYSSPIYMYDYTWPRAQRVRSAGARARGGRLIAPPRAAASVRDPPAAGAGGRHQPGRRWRSPVPSSRTVPPWRARSPSSEQEGAAAATAAVAEQEGLWVYNAYRFDMMCSPFLSLYPYRPVARIFSTRV